MKLLYPLTRKNYCPTIKDIVFVDRSGVENPKGFTKIARTSIIKHFQNFLLKVVAMSLGFFEFLLSIFFEVHENGFSNPYPLSLSDGGGFLSINPRKGTEIVLESVNRVALCLGFLSINPRKGTEIWLFSNSLQIFCSFCFLSINPRKGTETITRTP